MGALPSDDTSDGAAAAAIGQPCGGTPGIPAPAAVLRGPREAAGPMAASLPALPVAPPPPRVSTLDNAALRLITMRESAWSELEAVAKTVRAVAVAPTEGQPGGSIAHDVRQPASCTQESPRVHAGPCVHSLHVTSSCGVWRQTPGRTCLVVDPSLRGFVQLVAPGGAAQLKVGGGEGRVERRSEEQGRGIRVVSSLQCLCVPGGLAVGLSSLPRCVPGIGWWACGRACLRRAHACPVWGTLVAGIAC
jgi:hypothetical protein